MSSFVYQVPARRTLRRAAGRGAQARSPSQRAQARRDEVTALWPPPGRRLPLSSSLWGCGRWGMELRMGWPRLESA
jgi:hypothetical protein